MANYFYYNFLTAIIIAILVCVNALPTSVLVDTKTQKSSSDDIKGKWQTTQPKPLLPLNKN